MAFTAAAFGIAAVGGYAFLRTKTDNLWGDLQFVHRLIKGKREANALVQRGDWTIADFWEEHYQKGTPVASVGGAALSPTLSG